MLSYEGRVRDTREEEYHLLYRVSLRTRRLGRHMIQRIEWGHVFLKV